MKRPAKLLLAGSLLLVAALSASWFLSADNNGGRNSASSRAPILNEPMSGRVSVKLDDSPAAVGLPAKPGVPDEDAAWSGRTSGSKMTSVSFEVPRHHGFVALDFLNEGEGATTISVSHPSSGAFYFTESVEPGQPFAWSSERDYPEGMPSGTYTVSFHSSTAEVEASYSGRASQSGNS
ncbi:MULTISPECIES: hypothetical protein [Paenibacillus]|uniref:hypothetical protein n=1 Tax=Paenibacillus TaxID=44249 RepID=UPI00040D4B73|nr:MULTISPECIES: hypothetical protein [Paenibacillus]QGG58012.1 hypothetical protein GE073_22185 [Paenibacillus sp. B01]